MVIVNLHWGDEYRSSPSATQLALARRLRRTRAITAIVGQHAHVVQPIRRVGGRFVVFGLGNLISNQTAACCPAASQDGALAILHVKVTNSRGRVVRVRYVPTYVRHPDYAVIPVRRGVLLRPHGRGHGSWPRVRSWPSLRFTLTACVVCSCSHCS